MLIEIEKINGELIHSGDYDSLKSAVEHCVKNEISLNHAFLDGASLDSASLDGASLNCASLNHASLNCASLKGASLKSASLNCVSLNRAFLNCASLNCASLNCASLNGAFLNGAIYSILSILKINFNRLSDSLTLELMRWDCLSCGEEKMDIWKNGCGCPFKNSVREFYFHEKRELWIPGKPTMNYKELFIALCKEKEIEI